MQADFITAAVRTGGEGAQGVSLLLIEPAVTAGLTATKLDKMGWHCSDTAHLHFDGCRVPCKRERTHTGARARSVDAHGRSNPATVGSRHCERRVGLTAAVLAAARAPGANLIGKEDRGFQGVMLNFNNERLMLAAQSEALARACYEEALEWAAWDRTRWPLWLVALPGTQPAGRVRAGFRCSAPCRVKPWSPVAGGRGSGGHLANG